MRRSLFSEDDLCVTSDISEDGSLFQQSAVSSEKRL